MPAPESTPPSENRPCLGHVNLMVDTFIANANVDDLRAIIRSLLATGPPGFPSAFKNAARCRLRQTNAKNISPSIPFFIQNGGVGVPTPDLEEVLARARTLYGAGMGFDSLGILASVVKATLGVRWDEDSDMANALAVIDADIGQAIQSSKEELEDNRVEDLVTAREIIGQVRSAVNDNSAEVISWGGEFLLERAACSIEFLKV